MSHSEASTESPSVPRETVPEQAVPEQYTALVDDAAIFPPGDLPLEDAVPAFLDRRAEPWAALVGSFVVSDHRLSDLRPLLERPAPEESLPLTVVIGAGAGGIAPAASIVEKLKGAHLTGIEVALRDPADLLSNARRIVAALDQARDLELVDDDVAIHVELPAGPPTSGWLAAADEVAASELRLKFRTGGVDADLFPTAETLAQWIDAALDREAPFKCTAGLHNALRHTDPGTGFEHHGFLNVLAATRVALDGGDVVATLEERVGATLVESLPDAATLTRTRRWFTGFGSCSVTEPLDDLHALGLLGDDR